ncbi:MAG: ABC transporter ATP-binding protein [Deinococcus sp.]|nr:ABC transporter ATP-binding protein [Deinococcus sp.]
MPFLEARGITKYFPGVLANDAVDFAADRGEVHAVVGENGAGKSTLMRILYGLERPDAGEIFLAGERVTIPDPATAIRLGIGMVHQHFKLCSSLTVAENVVLGAEPHQGPLLDQRRATAQVSELAAKHGLAVDPSAQVGTLSVGVQQRIEILKLLYRRSQVLILDEPTAVLTPQEITELLAVLHQLAASGHTVILITHKLREVLAVAQRVTVMRRGRVVGVRPVTQTSEAELAQLMIGREPRRLERSATVAGEVALEVSNLGARGEHGRWALSGVSFTLHRGEVLGVAGVEGNGQRELVEALTGLRRPATGHIRLAGKPITGWPVRRRREAGLAHVPEDRTSTGVSPTASIEENLVATNFHRPRFQRWGWLRRGEVRRHAQQLLERYEVRASDARAPTGTLSGGNVQRVVLARELDGDPQVLIAAQPTRGLDIAGTEFVRAQLRRLCEQGRAVLLVSADLTEILEVSDRIIVLYRGRIAGELVATSADEATLGQLMLGGEARRVA